MSGTASVSAAAALCSCAKAAVYLDSTIVRQSRLSCNGKMIVAFPDVLKRRRQNAPPADRGRLKGSAGTDSCAQQRAPPWEVTVSARTKTSHRLHRHEGEHLNIGFSPLALLGNVL